MVDELPQGVRWNLETVTVIGDLVDDEQKPLTEKLELWYRDPVECIRELLGNPVFKDVIKYSPEKLYKDSEGKVEVFNEMWTAEWWWKIQVC